MDHGHMDHGHMDHGDMDMGGNQCQMNMLFTWSSKNLCIIFRQWHVTGIVSLLLSLVAIALLTAGYECVREITRKYEQSHNARMAAFSNSASRKEAQVSAERKGTLVKALLYALQVFYSFFIMLLFMTYNGWVMLAVAVGAFIGYLTFSSDVTATKSVACH